MHWIRDIEVLTPLFNRGAYQDTPEIRVPSVRGMVRWWFRALEYQSLPANEHGQRERLQQIREEEKLLFGGVHNGAAASRLVFRLRDSTAQPSRPKNPYTLPHKEPARDPQNLDTERDPRAPRAAFAAGAKFQLEVFSRLEGLDDALEQKASSALEVWTLLGSLGLRANRGGGSLWPADAPADTVTIKAKLIQLGCRWPVYLAGAEVGRSWLELQKAATDTVPEPRRVFGSTALTADDVPPGFPLVAQPFRRGDRSRRFSSPLKLKVVRLSNELRLLITAPSEQIITEARDALLARPCGALSKPETWTRISP
jgi:CRISPR type III-B/RAMP module RAMP protein Cmr1